MHAIAARRMHIVRSMPSTKTVSGLGFTAIIGSFVFAVACSPSVEMPETTCKTAKCKAAAAAAAAPASAAPQTLPAVAPPIPAVFDAGVDAAPLVTPAGAKPRVPPPNFACRDLTRCCSRIRSGIEKAACMAVAIAAKPSVCATAVIGYQILGCGHAPFQFGQNDDDGDGTPDFVDTEGDTDYSLDDYCAYYPGDEVCTSGGSSGYDSDPCMTNPNGYECTQDPWGASDPNFGYDPSYDPYGTGDPYNPGPSYDPYDPYGSGSGDPYNPDPSYNDPYDPYGSGDPYNPDPSYPPDDGSGDDGGYDDGWYW